MLGLGEERTSIHQLNDDLALPQSLLDTVVVFRFRHWKLQLLRHKADTIHIVFGFAAEPAGQLVRIVLVAGQICRYHCHTADTAAVVLDGARTVHNIRVFIQSIVREEMLMAFLRRNCFLRLGGRLRVLAGFLGTLSGCLHGLGCRLRALAGCFVTFCIFFLCRRKKRNRLQQQQRRQKDRKQPRHPRSDIIMGKDAHSASLFQSAPTAGHGKTFM